MSANNLKVGSLEIIPYERKQESFQRVNKVQNIPTGRLSEGATGEEVHRLQSHLRQLGYLQDDDAVKEGEFDAATVNAVKHYQSFYSLPVTGNLDDGTLKR